MDEIIEICNYIQRKLNECQEGKVKYFVNPAFACEEGSGYITALMAVKKGLMKRGLWEITIEEHKYTIIDTTDWLQNLRV